MAEDSLENSAAWEPLSSVDYFMLGLVGTFQAAALLVCAHLIWYRRWPPYVTKNVNIVVITILSGVLWTVTKAIEAGFIRRRVGDILAACDFERFLAWSTLTVHVVAFFIRIYRMWRILIKHDGKMWRTEHQILCLSSICLIPVVATWLLPRTGFFDEVANSCATTTVSMYPTLGMNALGLFGICFLWFVCVRQLKSVRKQFNEYDNLKRTLLYITVALLSYAFVVVILLAGRHVTVRRVSIIYPVLTTYILLWGSIREPFTKKMLGDNDYLLSFTKGFSELPSPAQLKASLAEQLSVDQLRIEFRRYIETKVAQELVDFYLDSLDREEVKDFFERQAVTMRIVQRYIAEGAPDQVNISEYCRETVLATDVTAYDIFDGARSEVLDVMETNFQRDFVATEGFRRIADASEQEQRELGLLRAGGMLPVTPPTPISPSSSPLHSALFRAVKKLPLIRIIAAAGAGATVSGEASGSAAGASGAAAGISGSAAGFSDSAVGASAAGASGGSSGGANAAGASDGDGASGSSGGRFRRSRVHASQSLMDNPV